MGKKRNVESGLSFLYQGLGGLAGLSPSGAQGAEMLAAQAQSEAMADTVKRQKKADKKAKKIAIAGTVGEVAGTIIAGPVGAAVGRAGGEMIAGQKPGEALKGAGTAFAASAATSALSGAVKGIRGGAEAAKNLDTVAMNKGLSPSVAADALGSAGVKAPGVLERAARGAVTGVKEGLSVRREKRDELADRRANPVQETRADQSALENPMQTRILDFLEKHDTKLIDTLQALAMPGGAVGETVTPHSLLDPGTSMQFE